ncbi:Fe2+-enterobactin ABC transporter substrate-binding protein [Bordetella sp. J329]|jgi:iron complex transport system substrate-binding protein|uniref:Fe2+-enterobactin ABC transporter substrate-binding protein n=1 Tax=Kerstersia gyiorum TaxID=206506 RepID=UPI000FD8F33F|nr:Fe2+-enterobactin ABC transporter substrate-binding protein [Kerstersia gyiorum]AZV92916.1 Fe2+-enterobactin ABC transporter substrate-binding protein [Bordetella sp. J329]MCH4271003.1 Fe2+-enterobactin ABC transporter substrate-binding protein [Kerstersia gyiorum]MCI1229994.1 Fe2+-enterobactin ABC transporter substrate-binding protein [Kerstersia gyiorum]
MRTKKSLAAFGLMLMALLMLLARPAQAGTEAAAEAATASQPWPRDFHNADGSITHIPAQPKRILSTTPTITGTLLAIDAPVVASASAANGQFFAQWAEVAKARNLEKAWPAGRVDLETAYAYAPDLIVVATSGADSALEHIASLRQIAPTIVLDYGRRSWQDLARQLAEATGLEHQAEARIEAFDQLVADARDKIKLPAGQANIISYNGASMENPLGTRTGAHGRLLQALGFDIEAPNPAWQSNADVNHDFIWAPYEKLPQLKAETTFLLRVGDERRDAFLKDPVLANLPSVKSGQVYGLGANSFRIDYYSATEIVNDMVKRFGQ